MVERGARPGRVVGILGGMGPLAGVDLMEKVIRATGAERDQDHIPLVLVSDPQVPPRTPAVLGSGESPLPAMLRGVRALERAGAGCVAIACNTAHHWHAELAAATRLEVLHVADAVARALERRGGDRPAVGLLATAGTIAAGFYQQRLGERGYATLVPRDDEQRDVAAGIDRVKSGEIPAARPVLARAVEVLLERGAGVVLLACTEVPIALGGGHPSALGERCLDATRALAEACVEWARGAR